jgi:hypothetical protein
MYRGRHWLALVQCYGPFPLDFLPTRPFECSTSPFEASSPSSVPNLADRTAVSLTTQPWPQPRAMLARERDPGLTLVLAENALMEPSLVRRPSHGNRPVAYVTYIPDAWSPRKPRDGGSHQARRKAGPSWRTLQRRNSGEIRLGRKRTRPGHRMTRASTPSIGRSMMQVSLSASPTRMPATAQAIMRQRP